MEQSQKYLAGGKLFYEDGILKLTMRANCWQMEFLLTFFLFKL